MNYFIFSDESGYWNKNRSNEDYYIRCWIVVHSGFINSIIDNNGSINLENLKGFFAIVKLSDFYSEKYKIRENIESSLKNIFEDLKQLLKEYMQDIKPAVLSAVNRILFLHTYEKYSWVNFFKALELRGEEIDKIIIDNPQFNKKEYKKMLLSIENINLKEEQVKFKEDLSQQNKLVKFLDIPDRYGGYVSKIMTNTITRGEKEDFLNFYNLSISEKIAYGNILPGIEKIFRGYENDVKFIRSKLSEILIYKK
jgi:hypothetical protein